MMERGMSSKHWRHNMKHLSVSLSLTLRNPEQRVADAKKNRGFVCSRTVIRRFLTQYLHTTDVDDDDVEVLAGTGTTPEKITKIE